MFGVMFLVGGIVANGNLAWGISQYSTSLIIAGIILIVIGLILLAIKDFEVLRNLSQNDWPELPPP
jgi:cytochrome c biogenesis protein CcdA